MRYTKRIIVFSVCVAVLLAAVGVLAWATSGFKNWDAKTWFDNWGVKTEAPDEDTDTSEAANMARAAVNASLNHDSDDVDITATVTGYDAPTIISYTAYGPNGGNPTVKVGNTMSSGGKYPVYPPNDFNFTVNVYTWTISGLKLETTTTCTQSLHTLGDVGYYGLVDVTYFDSYYTNVNQSQPNYYILGFQTPAKDLAASEEVICVFVRDSFPTPEFTYADGEFSFNSRMNDGALGIRCYDGTDRATAENVLTCYSKNSLTNDFTAEYGTTGAKFDITEIPFLREHIGAFTVEIYSNALPQADYPVMYLGCEPNELPHVTYEVKKLPTPTNIQFDNGTLKWNEVEGADGYMVFWNNKQSDILTAPEFDTFAAGISAGEYTFRIRAIGNMDKAFENSYSRSITAYNAGSTITRVVALNLCVNGDTITKLVPYNGNINEYLHEVEITGSLFGGWFYDSGFSRAVGENDLIVGDTTVYARLSDEPTNTATWWEKNMWYVLGAIICVVVLAVIVGTVLIIKRRRENA